MTSLTIATVSMRFNDIRWIIFTKLNSLQDGSANWLGPLGDAEKSSEPEMEVQQRTMKLSLNSL